MARRQGRAAYLQKFWSTASLSSYYRGIPHLSIEGKVFARVTLTRLQSLASQVYPELQCGSELVGPQWTWSSPLDSCRRSREHQQQPLVLTFVDLTKAFDLVSRTGLLQILQRIGCPPKLFAFITAFHENMQRTAELTTEDAYGGSAMYTVWNPISCQGTRGPTTPSLQGCLRRWPATHWNRSQHKTASPRRCVKEGALRAETKARAEAAIKRAAIKKRQGSFRETNNYVCTSCNKDCYSRIGLLSHSKACWHCRWPSSLRGVEKLL